MRSKKGSFILILLLLIVLVFIVGVRYGQRVEMANKAVSLNLSLTPNGPTTTKAPLRFTTYINKACGFELLHPSTVNVIKQSTDEAKLSTEGNLAVAVSCGKAPSFASFFEDKSVATQEVKFKNQIYQAKSRKTNEQKYISFTIRNPFSGTPVHLVVEEKLFPLIESSLIFK